MLPTKDQSTTMIEVVEDEEVILVVVVASEVEVALEVDSAEVEVVMEGGMVALPHRRLITAPLPPLRQTHSPIMPLPVGRGTRSYMSAM